MDRLFRRDSHLTCLDKVHWPFSSTLVADDFITNLYFHFVILFFALVHFNSVLQMLASLARYLEPLPDDEGDPFLTQIQALFQSDFISKQQPSDQEEGESNIPPEPVDSDDPDFDQLISQERQQEGDLETNSSTVLHLGSVLSTEHDYLL